VRLFLKRTRKGKMSPLPTGLGKEFASETATVNGITLHYIRGGNGPAVILIHGFPQDWFEYHAIMPRLAKQFTVIAIDLRGVGGSTAAPDGYDAANMAEDVYQLAAVLKLERVYLVGHDIGGMVAYAFVRRYPQVTHGSWRLIMKRNTALGVLGMFALSLSVYTDAQQPATFHGEISDSQCALNVHSLSRSHEEMLKSKSGAAGANAASCSLYCIQHLGGKFVLATKQHVYHLDDQELLRNFVGERVKLHGILGNPYLGIISGLPVIRA
jgi:pimeloyl-ACP methyl ester carboxylesterase